MPQSERTALAPSDEIAFQAWANESGITDVDAPASRYDYRGYWKEHGSSSMRFGEDHFTDRYKQHGHPLFSSESQYSRGKHDGGQWLPGDVLVPPPMSSHGGAATQGKQMPQAVYRVEMEDGSVFDVEVEGDQPPTEEEILAHLSAEEQPKADQSVFARLQSDLKPMASHGGPFARPAPVAGRGTQLDLSKSDAAAPYLLTAASMVPAVRGVRAGVGLLGGASTLAKSSAPIFAQEAMDAVGVPKSISVPASMGLGAMLGRPTPKTPPRVSTPRVNPMAQGWAARAKPAPSAAPAPPTASTPGLPASSAAPAAASTPALGRPSARAAASTPPTPRISAPTPPAPKGSAATPAPTSDAASWKPPLFSNLPERVPGKVSLNDALAARRSPTPTTQAAKATFNAAEAKVYSQLRAAGKSHQEALAAIEAQRALAATLGTPSSETVRRAVRERNDTGQWERPRPHRSEKR